MGVSGLWDHLLPDSQAHSLAKLAWDHYHETRKKHPEWSEHRCFLRVGVDASLWLFHVKDLDGKDNIGPNPDIRQLFYRLSKFLPMPLTPLLVFDGPHRPPTKRGQTQHYNGTHREAEDLKSMVRDVFGWPVWTAPGEAEAELAELQKRGEIDWALTDDVDFLVFGGQKFLRNPSKTLTGSIAAARVSSATSTLSQAGKSKTPEPSSAKDNLQYITFSSIDILNRQPVLTSRGMTFIALLSGGDYNEAGLRGCGPSTALGLAKCGFGESLLEAYHTMHPPELNAWLRDQWVPDMVKELETNSMGVLGQRNPAMAKTLKSVAAKGDFPDIQVLDYYQIPATSYNPETPKPHGLFPGVERLIPAAFKNYPTADRVRNLARLAEQKFYWTHPEQESLYGQGILLKKLGSIAWSGSSIGRNGVIVRDLFYQMESQRLRILEKSAVYSGMGLDQGEIIQRALKDIREEDKQLGKGTNVQHLKKIQRVRKPHISTGNMLEYRVLFSPTLFNTWALEGMSSPSAPPRAIPRSCKKSASDPHLRAEASSDLEIGDEDGEDSGPSKSSKGFNANAMGDFPVYVPGYLMEQITPDLVDDFNDMVSAKEKKKKGAEEKKFKRSKSTSAAGESPQKKTKKSAAATIPFAQRRISGYFKNSGSSSLTASSSSAKAYSSIPQGVFSTTALAGPSKSAATPIDSDIANFDSADSESPPAKVFKSLPEDSPKKSTTRRKEDSEYRAKMLPEYDGYESDESMESLDVIFRTSENGKILNDQFHLPKMNKREVEKEMERARRAAMLDSISATTSARARSKSTNRRQVMSAVVKTIVKGDVDIEEGDVPPPGKNTGWKVPPRNELPIIISSDDDDDKVLPIKSLVKKKQKKTTLSIPLQQHVTSSTTLNPPPSKNPLARVSSSSSKSGPSGIKQSTTSKASRSVPIELSSTPEPTTSKQPSLASLAMHVNPSKSLSCSKIRADSTFVEARLSRTGARADGEQSVVGSSSNDDPPVWDTQSSEPTVFKKRPKSSGEIIDLCSD